MYCSSRAAEASRPSFAARRQRELARACPVVQCSSGGVRLRLSQRLAAIATGFACGSWLGDFCATRTKKSRVTSLVGAEGPLYLTQRGFAAYDCPQTLCKHVLSRARRARSHHITKCEPESTPRLRPNTPESRPPLLGATTRTPRFARFRIPPPRERPNDWKATKD